MLDERTKEESAEPVFDTIVESCSAPPMRRLDERAAAEEEEEEEEEPVVESTALCGLGGSVLRMLRAVDADHLTDKMTTNPLI